MPEYKHHKSLRLENFTVFSNATFDFSPGVNVFIGENGSGKTHLLKAIYARQRTPTRDVPDLQTTLLRLFQTDDITNVMRSPSKRGGITAVQGHYDDGEWAYALQKTSRDVSVTETSKTPMRQPVFLPALDMMGHTKGFQEAYNKVSLDFDLTCYDILNLFRLKNREVKQTHIDETLSKLLEGEIVDDESTGRFYLKTLNGRLEMPMVAEGLRKIASLVRLQQNNWLLPGTTLYWDEPEVNINPILMDDLIKAILTMARQGVQVFLTTHSYVILKELDLQATLNDAVRFFSLHNTKSGTNITTADELAALDPNPILQHYGLMYDRDLDRAIGKERQRANLQRK